MGLYLLKSAACLAIFYSFYKLFLEQENMHTLKRFYLLGALGASFGIPFVTFTEYAQGAAVLSEALGTLTVVEATPSGPNALPMLLWAIYGLGLFYFGGRFVKNLWFMVRKIQKHPHVKEPSFAYVLLNSHELPHTFLRFIFLDRKAFETGAIPKQVLEHEAVHAKEWHTLDLLLAELLQAIFWFNPFLYGLKHSIKLNHEFLADRAVLRTSADPTAYQNLILSYSSHAPVPSLAHSIHYSFIKKRFTVMKKHTSKKSFWFRSLILLPLLALVIYGFSAQETVVVPNKNAKTENATDGATREEMKEYNGLAKKYNAMKKEERIVALKDLKRMEYIYNKMSTKQRADAEPFPECIPPPPPAPDAPEAPEADETPEMDSTPPKPDQVAAYGPAEDPAAVIRGYILNGAEFFMDGKPVPPDEAMKWIRFEPGFRIEVDSSDPKKFKVYLIGC